MRGGMEVLYGENGSETTGEGGFVSTSGMISSQYRSCSVGVDVNFEIFIFSKGGGIRGSEPCVFA